MIKEKSTTWTGLILLLAGGALLARAGLSAARAPFRFHCSYTDGEGTPADSIEAELAAGRLVLRNGGAKGVGYLVTGRSGRVDTYVGFDGYDDEGMNVTVMADAKLRRGESGRLRVRAHGRKPHDRKRPVYETGYFCRLTR